MTEKQLHGKPHIGPSRRDVLTTLTILDEHTWDVSSYNEWSVYTGTHLFLTKNVGVHDKTRIIIVSTNRISHKLGIIQIN